MTDRELISLIEKTEPRDLTGPQLQAIQDRLAESPELREALVHKLQLESSIASTLGQPNVSVEAIFQQYHRRRALGWVAPTVGVVLCLVAVVIGGLALYQAMRPSTPSEEPIARNTSDGDEPIDPVSQPIDEEPPEPEEIAPEVAGDEHENEAAAVRVANLPFEWQAEAFARGNVEANQAEWGAENAAVIQSTQSPAFVEYELNLPQAEELELHVRYASFDSRPLTAIVNGQKLPQSIASEQTGGGTFEHQTWVSAGTIAFQQGDNTLRLETAGRFPYIDQWKLQPVSTQPAPTDEPEKPWSNLLAENHETYEFDDVCFNEFDLDIYKANLEDVQQWFTMVSGTPSYIRAFRRGNWRGGQLDGTVRLKSPWREGFALRFLPQVEDKLHIHCYVGDRGVTFSYYLHELNRWAAYNTTRSGDSPTPESFVLASSDNGRNRRTEIHRGGSYLLHYRQGELILSRGDVFLTSAHIGAPPESVFFEGKTLIDGIELLHIESGVEEPQPREIVEAFERPADLHWSEPTGKGLNVQRSDDGAIRLEGDKAEQRGWVTTRIENLGARFIECELVDPRPGSGLFLGRGESGDPQEVVRFFRNSRDGKTCVGITGNDDGRDRDFTQPNERLTPIVGEKVYIRMLFGAGVFHFWVSADGEYWARSEQPWIDRPGDVTHLGLHCAAQAENCGITLSKLLIREVGGLAAAAPQDLVDRAPTGLHLANGYSEWFAASMISQPAGIEPGEWLRACAVAALRDGVSRRAGNDILLRLIEHSANEFEPATRIDLIADASLLLDLRDNADPLHRLIEFAGEIGLEAGDAKIAQAARRRLMATPFHSNQTPPIFHEELATAQIAALVQGDAGDLNHYLKMLRFYHFNDRTPLDDWAAAQIGADLSERSKRLPTQWRHPWNEQIDKDAYNQLAEMRALIQGEAFDDAARRIATIESARYHGLAPVGGDDDWMASVSTAIALLIGEHPQLRETINNEYAPLAELRLKRAVTQRDLVAIKSIARQFQGTPAAVEAHRWIGDWALAGGMFERAVGEFNQARNWGDTSKELNARLRLAGAMIGENLGEPASGEVDLGDYTLSAEEFESLVAGMQSQASGASHSSSAGGTSTLPEPTALKLENCGRLDGRVGESPNSELVRNVNRYRIDWVGKQIAVTQADDIAYVSNRFHVAAYKTADGSRIWQSEQPQGKQLKSQEYAFSPARPLVQSDSIFARQLFGDGPKVVCLNRENGKIVWQSSSTSSEFIVSDPIFVQGELKVVGVHRVSSSDWNVEWLTLNASNGDVISRRTLIKMRESWLGRRFCQLAATGDGAVVALGGIVVHCDAAGELRWVRRQVVTPVNEDTTWVMQSFQPPIIREGRVIVAQGGVRSIDCLDIQTGRLIWRRVTPTIHRILCSTDELLVLQNGNGLLAFERETGETRWRCRFNHKLLQAHVADAEKLILCENTPRTNENPYTAQLVWVDLKTGDKIGSSPLRSVNDDDPRIGPMFFAGETLWFFRGRNAGEPYRDFARLTPDDANQPFPPASVAGFPTGALPKLNAESKSRFSDWDLLSASERSEGVKDNIEGQNNVLVLRAAGGRPVVLARRAMIPSEGQPKFKVHLGHRDKHLYVVKVYVNGEVVAENTTDKLPGEQPWGTMEIDLSPWAGKEVWVAVRAEGRYGGEEVDTLWRELKIE